jgi:hypothetical protein
MKPEKLQNIEAGRGVAAMLMAFYRIDKYYL